MSKTNIRHSHSHKHQCDVPKYVFMVSSKCPPSSGFWEDEEEQDLCTLSTADSVSTTTMDEEDLSSCSSCDGEGSEEIAGNHRCSRRDSETCPDCKGLPPLPKRVPSSRSIFSSGSDTDTSRVPVKATAVPCCHPEQAHGKSSDKLRQASHPSPHLFESRTFTRRASLGDGFVQKRQSLPPRLPQRKGSHVSNMTVKSSTM